MQKKKNAHGQWLRIGFGIFFLIWGLDKVFRTDTWANPQMLGSFYGNIGAITQLVVIIGLVQILIAISFFANKHTDKASIAALVMIGASTLVTIVPLAKYVIGGGTPIPTILFVDHFPLLAGAYAIYRHAK